MNTKSMRIVVLSGLVILITAALAFAQPGMGRGGWGPGGCPGYGAGQVQNLTPEQQQKFDALFAEHQKKAFALHEDIWAKKAELNALAQNPNTKPERITQLVNEIKTLRAKQYEQREAFRAALQKAGLPAAYGNCGGVGGGCGDGPHGGRGMMRGGW